MANSVRLWQVTLSDGHVAYVGYEITPTPTPGIWLPEDGLEDAIFDALMAAGWDDTKSWLDNARAIAAKLKGEQ